MSNYVMTKQTKNGKFDKVIVTNDMIIKELIELLYMAHHGNIKEIVELKHGWKIALYIHGDKTTYKLVEIVHEEVELGTK